MNGLKHKETNLGGLDGAVTWEKYSWFAGNPRITSDTVLMVWKVEKGAKNTKTDNYSLQMLVVAVHITFLKVTDNQATFHMLKH